MLLFFACGLQDRSGDCGNRINSHRELSCLPSGRACESHDRLVFRGCTKGFRGQCRSGVRNIKMLPLRVRHNSLAAGQSHNCGCWVLRIMLKFSIYRSIELVYLVPCISYRTRFSLHPLIHHYPICAVDLEVVSPFELAFFPLCKTPPFSATAENLMMVIVMPFYNPPNHR